MFQNVSDIPEAGASELADAPSDRRCISITG